MEGVKDQDYVIRLAELRNGSNEYSFRIGKAFFDYFECGMVNGADLSATVVLEKSGTCIRLRCAVSGNVVVPCDRCLDDLTLPVDFAVDYTVKFIKGAEEEWGDDFIILPSEETELDMKQMIYDYVIIGLPVQKVHDIKDCNPDVVSRISVEHEVAEVPEQGSSPFSGLRDLMDRN